MKQWKLFAAGISLFTVTGLAQADITDDPVQVSDQIFRAGVEYCNNAARLSRTDSRQARSEINQYVAHFERASAVLPTLLEQNSFAQREHLRCQRIGQDIARAEALPVIEKGLAMCQDARSALRGGDLKDSRYRFSQYELNRDRALRLSDSVLKVGSIAVQVRICNGLGEKIAVQGQGTVNRMQMVAIPPRKAPETGAQAQAVLVNNTGADL